MADRVLLGCAGTQGVIAGVEGRARLGEERIGTRRESGASGASGAETSNV